MKIENEYELKKWLVKSINRNERELEELMELENLTEKELMNQNNNYFNLAFTAGLLFAQKKIKSIMQNKGGDKNE